MDSVKDLTQFHGNKIANRGTRNTIVVIQWHSINMGLRYDVAGKCENRKGIDFVGSTWRGESGHLVLLGPR